MAHLMNVIDDAKSVASVIDDIISSGRNEGFYVCEIDSIVAQHRLWMETMKRIKPHYAVKCNNNELIVRLMASLGANFDCASKAEMDQVLSMNISPDRIVYSNTVKPLAHLLHAKDKGVNLMTFDNESELHKLKQHHPTAKLLLRIKCDDPSSIVVFGAKFGCCPVTEAADLLKLAKQLRLNVVGVHFHVGSGSEEPAFFRTALEHARGLFDFAATIGYAFKVLDIGGGFPGSDNQRFRKITKVIGQGLRDVFPEPEIEVIAEPGRFFVCGSCTLTTKIISVRKRKGVPRRDNMYYVDDGVFQSFLAVAFNEPRRPSPLKDENKDELPCIIWGPTCDSFDCVARNYLLPDLDVGDWIKFENMGDYSISLATKFNGFSSSELHFVIRHSTWLLLRGFPLLNKCFVE